MYNYSRRRRSGFAAFGWLIILAAAWFVSVLLSTWLVMVAADGIDFHKGFWHFFGFGIIVSSMMAAARVKK